MDDPATVLKAGLDEDEAAAKAWLPFGNPDATQREHIARHDPARVLREATAKREILTAYIKAEADGGRGDGWIALRFAVETLAEAYAETPEKR